MKYDPGVLTPYADPRQLASNLGPTTSHGVLRAAASDFLVHELPLISPSGNGEHFYVEIEKTGRNTQDVAAILARAARVKRRDVGYAGMKDRRATTTQWFSIWLPGAADPDLSELPAGLAVLKTARHHQKLRRGMLAGNRFRIRITDILAADSLESRLRRVSEEGVPAYYGRQRFGINAGNLSLLKGTADQGRSDSRHARQFGLSAMRSALFNGFLDMRVRNQSWNRPTPGEMVLDPEDGRYAMFDGSSNSSSGGTSGLLWGAGRNSCSGPAREIEDAWFGRFLAATELLESYDVRMQRRPLVLRPGDFCWRFEPGCLVLSFDLPRGAFATSVIDAVLATTDGRADGD
jgi:tRNA pseudouridine13 synthase